MASLEMNKIAAGVLCAGLVAMAAGKIADVLVDPKPLEKNAYVGNVESAGTASPLRSVGLYGASTQIHDWLVGLGEPPVCELSSLADSSSGSGASLAIPAAMLVAALGPNSTLRSSSVSTLVSSSARS